MCGFCLHTVQSAFVFDYVITTDYGILYCADRANEEKKVEGAGRMGRPRVIELISSSPTLILRWTRYAAWWHVVWKAISSAICVSLLPMVGMTLWWPRSKSLFFWLLFLSGHTAYTHSALPVCLQNCFVGYKQHSIWLFWLAKKKKLPLTAVLVLSKSHERSVLRITSGRSRCFPSVLTFVLTCVEY